MRSRQAPHCPTNRKANVQGGGHCAVVAVTAPMRWLHQWVVGAAVAAVVVVVALVAVAVSTTPEVGAGRGQEKRLGKSGAVAMLQV